MLAEDTSHARGERGGMQPQLAHEYGYEHGGVGGFGYDDLREVDEGLLSLADNYAPDA